MKLLRVFLALSILTLWSCSSERESKVQRRLLQIAQYEDQGTIGPERELVTLLFHSDLEVRRRAVLAIGRIGDASTMSDLAGAATLDTAQLRSAAAWAMGQLASEFESEDTENFLTSLFTDTAAAVRQNVMDAMAHVTNSADGVEPFLLLFGIQDGRATTRGNAAIALGRLDEVKEIRELLRLLKDSDVGVRWRTAWALWRLKDPRATATLHGALHDSDARVRFFSARALGEIGNAISADSLVPLLTDSDWRVRNDAASALGKVGQGDAALDLMASRLADEENELVAATIAEALGRVHRQKDLVHFRELLRRRSGTLWRGLTNGLANGYPEKAASLIQAMIQDKRPDVSQNALKALGIVGDESARSTLTKVYPTLGDPAKGVALTALAEFEFTHVEYLLDDALASGDLVLGQSAASLLSNWPDSVSAGRLTAFWDRHAADDTSDFKITALQTAAKFADSSVDIAGMFETWLRAATNDPDRLVRAEAIEALSKLGIDESARLGTFRPRITEDNFEEVYEAFDSNPRAIIKTDHGDIEVELLYDVAPRTVYNFVTLAKSGFYDDIVFHRVVANFVIQSGAPDVNGYGGPGYTVRSEFSDLTYSTGTMGMASSGKDTEGSQWFITHSPQPHLDDRYTIFGQVLSGQEVVDRIRQGNRIQTIEIHAP